MFAYDRITFDRTIFQFSIIKIIKKVTLIVWFHVEFRQTLYTRKDIFFH